MSIHDQKDAARIFWQTYQNSAQNTLDDVHLMNSKKKKYIYIYYHEIEVQPYFARLKRCDLPRIGNFVIPTLKPPMS